MNSSQNTTNSFFKKVGKPFGQKNASFNKNYKIKNNISSFFQNISPGFWLWWVLYVILAVVICYLTVMTTKYLSTKCPHKRGWFSYIFRFCYSDVCKKPEAAVVTNVHYMSDLPSEMKPKKHMPPPHLNKTNPAVEYDIKELEKPEQVFHISNQDYSYDQAKCKCASYDAKLATYGQMVEAYNKGADWCSYGWSEGQTAYYPTQKCKWEAMSEEEREECGKPGVNGGFFSDPYLKFGVNCFGKKPEGKVIKIKHPECKQNYCKMKKNYFASHRLETDEIAPFNDNQWSA